MAGEDVCQMELVASRRARRSRQQQHDLTGMPLGKKFALRVGDRGERISPGEDRPDLAALNVAYQIGEERGRRDGAAEQSQVLEVQCAQIKLDDWPGDGSRDRVATAASKDIEQSGELHPTDDVDHDIHGLSSDRSHEMRIAGQY